MISENNKLIALDYAISLMEKGKVESNISSILDAAIKIYQYLDNATPLPRLIDEFQQ